MTIESLPTSPKSLRTLVRDGNWPKPTAGLAPGRVQANLVILPYDQAFDFLLFCQRNPKPCPLIEVLEPGRAEAVHSAPNSDIRSDLPLYRVYRYGDLVAEVEDIRNIWEDHLVTFLLGCSFSFESALLSAGIPKPAGWSQRQPGSAAGDDFHSCGEWLTIPCKINHLCEDG